MKRPQQASPLQQLITEVLDLLVAYWLFKRRSAQLVAENPGGLQSLEELVGLQSLTQDIVLRLCKLGDTRRDVWSFRQATKHLRKRASHTRLPGDLDAQLEKFDMAIQDIKAHHRDSYMAHLAKERPFPFKPAFDLREAVRLAVKICDLLRNERVEYKIDASWAGGPIDLRESLEAAQSSIEVHD